MKLFIATLILLASCAPARQSTIAAFTITAINGDKFTARAGDLVGVFKKLPGDSVWVGKRIDVSVVVK